ncbi:MAG: ATP-binding protein [Acidobacteria bacterium]|nr:ATP-binding protein [Acidobacteriota bacterium]
MRELVVISGKGGTGKTSIVGSFAALAKNAVFADCDVDASDLHLILSPEIIKTEQFVSGHEAEIIEDKCTGCGRCYELCRFDAISRIKISDSTDFKYSVKPYLCEGCGVCYRFCPADAIHFEESLCGEWYIADTRFGHMVYARLAMAAENSGKLVTIVRQQARKIAEESGADLILVDGPPGIGCPVISSITGATSVLIVTEPTLSGLHDMERVLSLTSHFKIPAMVCINKWDINMEISDRIEEVANQKCKGVIGRIRYDKSVTEAQVAVKTTVEYGGAASEDIEAIWRKMNNDKFI